MGLPLPEKLLLTTPEAAEYCGVSEGTFRAHVKVAPVKIGSAVRYDRRELDRWAANQNRDTPQTGDDWLERLDAGGKGVRA